MVGVLQDVVEADARVLGRVEAGEALCRNERGHRISASGHIGCDHNPLSSNRRRVLAGPLYLVDPCNGIGAYGFGPCNGIGIAEEDPVAAVVPLFRHFASPNPFGYTTVIQYQLGSSRPLWLAIYDLSGRRVKLLEDRVVGAGLNQASWDGTDDAGRPVASGVYVYRFGGGVPVTSGRLVLAR